MYTFKKRHEIWILRRIWHPKTYSDVKLEGYKLSRQTDFYKKIHPEQFSDSTMVRVGSLDKDFFDFYLESLTSKGLEKEFEKFCRYIAEAEICPNLLPQTGPTGGGDSKVDSETYPVAESISELWYHGDGNKAGTERWAFAISAKRDWKPKVKSDVTKIVSVNSTEGRNYTKIFFMSNQYISDKKRADAEDALRREFDIDVRILDRTWLLEKVFANPSNKVMTVQCFSLSDNFKDEVKIGSKDHRRKQELIEIEDRLKCSDIKPAERVSLVRRSVILGRELEFPFNQMQGLLDRYERLTNEYGSKLEIAECIYDTAWTIYWWYQKDDLFYSLYLKYEAITMGENNVYLFSNLITLWINLFSISSSAQLDIDKHSHLLKQKYQELISDPSKPNTALEAKASYQLMRLFSDDSIDDIVDDLIFILNESPGHIDLDIHPLNRVIQEFPLLEKAKRYNELFELGISLMSQKEKDTVGGIMLAKRGHSLKQEKPYEALTYFSRALMSFFNDHNKEHLIAVILEMAEIFESIGLLWAARNFYYYDFCLCLNQYMKFGESSPALFISAHSLKYLELRLGQVIYSCEFDFLEKIATHVYPEKVAESEEGHANYDYIVANQILRTPFETIKKLEKLPKYLEEKGLYYSAMAIKYELGYYDETMLSDLNEDKAAFDDLILKWETQPTLEKLNSDPWYGIELPYAIRTNLLGCSIEITILDSIEHGEVEVAATLIATIESFYGTGVSNDLISLAGKIKIKLSFDSDHETLISGKINDDMPNEIHIKFRDYKSNLIVQEQEYFSNFLTELLGMVTSIMFPFKSELNKVEKMIINDAAFARSHTFSNSVFYGMETLGKSTFSYDSLVDRFDPIPILRVEKPNSAAQTRIDESSEIKQTREVNYSKPPEGLGFDKIKQQNIKTSPIINVLLWNKSEWRGVIFINFPNNINPPILAPLFNNPACRYIFDEWIKDIGYFDSVDKIDIKILKGIDKKHPHWYRIIIGSAIFAEQKGNEPMLIVQPSRVHTMMPDSSINLKRFEDSLIGSEYYYICPALMVDSSRQPKLFEELKIKKKITSISICNAWEIEKDDILAISGILPTDNPIIPDGKEDLPIIAAINRKRGKND